jgi:hypothetical protein
MSAKGGDVLLWFDCRGTNVNVTDRSFLKPQVHQRDSIFCSHSMASSSKLQLEPLKSTGPDGSHRHAPTNVIWQWTLTPEAVASCFAQDVFDMEESGIPGT